MDLTHEFTVPTPVPETWAHFQDIASLAECFPGATVTDADDDTFKGSCKVKLGPIALVYNGSGTFTERNHEQHTFVVEAKGKDKRGNGTAGATVNVTMLPSSAAGGTDVKVVTDLQVTGKPAQFGRGVMQDVSDKLLGQFVSCLEQRLATEQPAAAGETGAGESGAAGDGGTSDQSKPVISVVEGGAGSSPGDPASASTPVAAQPVSSIAPKPVAKPTPANDDALDLGATVIPILIRTYGPQLGIGVIALVFGWLLGRRR